MTNVTPEQDIVIKTILVKLAQLGYEVKWAPPVTEGPLITTYRFVPSQATKLREITTLSDDLALELKVEDVLIRRMPGEGVIGVSVPRRDRQTPLWRNLLTSPTPESRVPLNFGVDSEGRPFREDLTLLPHLLVAGATGGGKSVFVRSAIASLMFWRSPEQVQLVLSDTKNVEFGDFVGSKHLLFDPAATMYRTWELMDWLIVEMENRLKTLACWQCRNIAEYHRKNVGHKMPYIVLVIDELADILGGVKRGEAKIAEGKLGKIVQKSRAAGVHVLAATQRPSVDVVKGSIKANFPARLTFRLPSEADSRTVLGSGGAEHLLARGDMLYSSPNSAALKRLHSAYAETEEKFAEDFKQCVSFAAQQRVYQNP